MGEKKLSAEIYELDAARARPAPAGAAAASEEGSAQEDQADSRRADRDGFEAVDAGGAHPKRVDPRNFVSVGAYLEAVRETQGADINAVSALTHIKPHFIEALEAMALDRLPSKAFAIGFARTYAEALGLNASQVVDWFKQEAGYADPPTQAAEAVDAAAQDEPASRGPSERQVSANRIELPLLAVVAILAFVVWCAMAATRPSDDQAFADVDAPTPLGAAFDPAEMDALAAPTPSAPVFVEAKVIERVEAVFPPRCVVGAMPEEFVEVAFTVRVDGRVVSERVTDTSNGCFRRAALGAVRQWRFAPRTVDGAPQAAFDQRAIVTFRKPS
ncbi:MAG: helix-turn-helix domain-containing protein [Pseudomonadota bacterium]